MTTAAWAIVIAATLIDLALIGWLAWECYRAPRDPIECPQGQRRLPL